MTRSEIKVGAIYYAKVSGKVTKVRIEADLGMGMGRYSSMYGLPKRREKHLGWRATNIETGRSVNIATAARLRGEAKLQRCGTCANCINLQGNKPIFADRLKHLGAEAAIPVRQEWTAFVHANPCLTPKEAK